MSARPLPSPTACVQLWQVDLDLPACAAGIAMLSDDEWARARRFAFERDRRRYLAAHAALRQLLSDATDLPGALLEWREGPHGKPALQPATGLQFNLSHSGNVALVAIHPRDELGVDVEQLRPLPDAMLLAEAHLTPDEQSALARLTGTAREQAFLCCWTRKEACLKAVGLGLGVVDTRSFHVGVLPESCEVRMPAQAGDALLALHSLALADTSAAGAVAVHLEPTGTAGTGARTLELCA